MPKIQNTLNLDSNDVENIGTLTATSVVLTGSLTSSNQATSKEYVDSVAVGLKPKDEVLCATDGILGGTPTYNPTGGVAGTGSISFAAGPSSIDGISINNGDRILVKDEGLSGGLGAAANGVYTRVSSTSWHRASDFDTAAEVKSGSYFFVTQGSANQKRGYVLTTPDPINVPNGTKSFAIFLESGVPVAGDGIDISGSTISLDLKANGGLIFDAGEVTVDLSASALTGTLAASFGGTGQSSYAAGDILYSPATNLLTKLTVGSLRQVLSVQASGTPHWRTPENQDSVLDDSISAPPGSPSTGDRYIVASGGSGAWLGQDDSIAEWNGSAWVFTAPVDGMRSYNKASDQIVIYDGSVWGAVSTSAAAADVSVAATPVNYTAATPDVEAHLEGIDTALGSVSVTLQDAYDGTVPAPFPLGGNAKYLDVDADPLAVTAELNPATPIPQFFGATFTGGWNTVTMGALNAGSVDTAFIVVNAAAAKNILGVAQLDGGTTLAGMLPVTNLSGFTRVGIGVGSVQTSTPPIVGGAMIQAFNGAGGSIEYTESISYTSLAGGTPAVGDTVTGSPSGATGTIRGFRENVAATSGNIIVGGITGSFSGDTSLTDGVWTASGAPLTVEDASFPSMMWSLNQGTINARSGVTTGILGARNQGTSAVPVFYIGNDGTQSDSLALLVNSVGGFTSPMLEVSNAGSGVDIQFTARATDPTTLVDGGIWYNSSTKSFKHTDSTNTYSVSRKVTGSINGDDVTTDFVVTHNLSTRDVSVAVREDVSPYGIIVVDVECTTTSSITVKFSVAPSSATSYTVTVIG